MCDNDDEDEHKEDEPRYDSNFLIYLSKTKKMVGFVILSVLYRIIIIYILLLKVYQVNSSKYKRNLETKYEVKDKAFKINDLICSLKGCNSCIGTQEATECISCYVGFEPIYGDNSSKTIIECRNPCKTGEGKMCKTCFQTKNECQTCNIGYYLASNGKCEKVTKNLRKK